MKRIFLPQFLFSNGCYEDVQKVEKAKNERKKKGGAGKLLSIQIKVEKKGDRENHFHVFPLFSFSMSNNPKENPSEENMPTRVFSDHTTP